MNEVENVTGHFYVVTLTRTTTEEAQVRVFIPDSARSSPAQLAFAQAQAIADGAWKDRGVNVSISALSQREAATIVEKF